MSDATPRAILLGGGITALSVARSLTAAEVEVWALGMLEEPLRFSRARRSFVAIDGGEGIGDRYFEWLERGSGEGVVLPCSDDALELVARRRGELAQLGYRTIEADDEVLLAMLDKERTFELAQRAGIEAPWVGTVGTLEAGVAAAERVGYPCALKPRHSHRFSHLYDARAKAFTVHDRDQLERRLAETLALGIEMMVAEIVPGPDTGICSYYGYIDERGETLLELTKRKLRQNPPKFGVGCYHLTDWNPEVAELGLRFLKGVGVRGLGNVEFKRDQRDGRLKLIECNSRFTLANEHLRQAGMDLAPFVYARILGRPTPPQRPYRRGLGYWYPVADLRAMIGYRRLGEQTVAGWARSLLAPQSFPVASLHDPLPSLVGAAGKLSRAVRRIRRES